MIIDNGEFEISLSIINYQLSVINYFSYFSEIEETFVRRRGRNLLLSPLDWALIEAWKERGIPLHVVLRGIETVFDSADAQSQPRKRPIKSLMYCREEVEAQFEIWLAANIGNQLQETTETDGEQLPFSREQILEHLQKAENSLRFPQIALNHNWRTISAQILTRLQTARKNFAENADAERLESVLNEIDRRVDEALLESFPADDLAAVKSETAAQLRAVRSRMSAETYQQTFKTLLLKTLREHAELSRLSLFYL